MKNSDRNFWNLTKEIAGLDTSKSGAVPDVDELAQHFAKKMSNGAGCDAEYYSPPDDHRVPLSSLRIRFKRVLRCLRRVDPDKASNGIGTSFLHHCADELAPAVDSLFKQIVRESLYPSVWKIGNITGAHKRGSVKVPANYRPIQVLDNLSSVFEEVISPQIKAWISAFTLDSQYGFSEKCGTLDYGAALTFTIGDCLERRGEGILITTDVKGAFDRSWWNMIKVKFKARGMRGRALKLLKSYLYKRFIRVVSAVGVSKAIEIFSSVPQGGKLSTDLWNFDCNDIEHAISED